MSAANTITRVPVPDLCCLWAEAPAAPMNIALVGIFDGGSLTGSGGKARLAEIRSLIAAHLDRAPALRRVLLPTRPGEGRMAWIDAQHLDIDDHVVLAAPGQPFTSEQDFLDWHAIGPGPRPHRALGQLTPAQADTRPPGPINLADHRIRRKQILGGLTHEYYVAALPPRAATGKRR